MHQCLRRTLERPINSYAYAQRDRFYLVCTKKSVKLFENICSILCEYFFIWGADDDCPLIAAGRSAFGSGQVVTSCTIIDTKAISAVDQLLIWRTLGCSFFSSLAAGKMFSFPSLAYRQNCRGLSVHWQFLPVYLLLKVNTTGWHFIDWSASKKVQTNTRGIE